MSALVAVMQKLLAPEGCPWDRKQTHQSLRPYLIEEAYEVLDAIDRGAPDELCDELGDVLLQVVFHAELARGAGHFTIDDVIDKITNKLVYRHPHVFGEAHVDSAAAVEAQWDQLKRKEGRRSVVGGGAKGLPALRRAQRLGERLARVGFDWPDVAGPRAKVDEELEELDEARSQGSRVRVEAELGDLLLAVANLARHERVDPEDALRGALDRFERRFAHVEERLYEQGRHPEECQLDELETLWEESKQQEREAS
jgi:MazG family protein